MKNHMARYEINVDQSYRLDLTVSVLRRLATNVVDLLTPDGTYMRALPGLGGPTILRVVQDHSKRLLVVSVDGTAGAERESTRPIRRLLGVDCDVSAFESAAAEIPWLAPLVTRMHGVRPPRYATLWEGCANSIVFQQVSLRAASTIMQRLIRELGDVVVSDDVPMPFYAFPGPERFQAAPDSALRAVGLSGSKVATLRGAAEAIINGTLSETALEQLPSTDAALQLRQIKGIGPWTAAVILLRGLGRLDVFPANDTSIASNIALVAGDHKFDPEQVLRALGSERGMLYFYLLLARLESRKEIGKPSF